MLQETANPESASASGVLEPRHGLGDRAGFALFLAALTLCPIPDGSIELIWIVIWGVLASASVLLLSYRTVSRAAALVIFACGLVAAAFVLVALLQSQAAGPFSLPVWREAGRLLGTDLPALATAVRDAPLLAVGGPLLAALLFIAGVVISDDARRVELICRVLIAMACLTGLIGFIALLFGIDALRPTQAPGALTTFFLNKNTTSTYLGSAFLLCLVLLLERLRVALRMSGGHLRSIEALAPGRGDRRVLIGLAFAALLLAFLIPMARSRSSFALVLVLSALAALVLFWGRAHAWRILAPVVLIMFAAAYGLAGQGIRLRFARFGLEDSERLEVYRLVLDGIAQHPALGFGLGTFPSVFPSLRNENLLMSGIWNMAHSTPLELALTGGIPLAAFVALFFGLCLVLLVRGIIRRPHDPYILGALLVGVLGALHSTVDFTLQIPGYLMIYAGVTGIGVGRALRPASKGGYERVRRQRSSAPEKAQ